jgi:hypothetical protein
VGAQASRLTGSSCRFERGGIRRWAGRRPGGARPEPPRTRKPRGHVGPPEPHAPEPPRTREHPHRRQAQQPRATPPTAPETADRSTAWIWPPVRVTMEWHRRVALSVPTLGQKACPWKVLDVRVAETYTLVAFRKHGRVGGDEASVESILRMRPCGRRLPQGNPFSQRLEAMSHL